MAKKELETASGNGRPATPRRLSPSALFEIVVAAAILSLCGWLGLHYGWTGQPRTATATALWPFYLDTWVTSTIWSGRVLLPGLAFLAARPLLRWFVAASDESAASDINIVSSEGVRRPELGGVTGLVGLAYLFHFGCCIIRFGASNGLVHTMNRWQEYWRDVPCVAAGFLAHFPEGCQLMMHASAHPPGIIILLSAVQRLGFILPADATLLCGTMAALAALPIYGAARRLADETSARFAVALYLYASSISSFAFLSMDMAILLFGAVALYGLARALCDDRHAWIGGLIWGVGLVAASLCSYLAGTLTLSYAALILLRTRKISPGRWLALLVGPLSFFSAYALLVIAAGYRPLHVLRENLHSLALSADGERSTQRALLGNPVAFLGSLGLPLCGLVAHSFGSALHRIATRRREDFDTVVLIIAAALPPLFSIALGKPRAEVERVYLPFAPLIIIAAATAARRFYGRGIGWLIDVALPLSALQAILIEVYYDTYW